MEDLEKVKKEIGQVPYFTTAALHVRVDRWGMKILGEIKDGFQKIETEKRKEKNRYLNI